MDEGIYINQLELEANLYSAKCEKMSKSKLVLVLIYYDWSRMWCKTFF